MTQTFSIQWTTLLKTTMALLLLSTLSGCGAEKVSNLASINSPGRTSTDTDSELTPVSACNAISSGHFKAGTMIYVDTAGNVRNEALRMKIVELANGFEQDDRISIKFFRWSPSATPQLDPQPLEFAFELTQGRVRLEDTATSLTWPLLQELGAAIGMQGQGAAAILRQVTVLINLKDPQAEYEAIKVVAYRQTTSSGGSEVVGEVDTLIPSFYANPKDYAKGASGEGRPMSLLKLHPFYASINNSDLSAEDYRNQAQDLCWGAIH